VAVLLAEGVHPDARDRWGKTALYYAAKAGHVDALTLLLRWGADADAAALQGSTPLMVAAAAGQRAAVQLLLDHGADPTLANCDGRRAADFAVDAALAARLRAPAATAAGAGAPQPPAYCATVKPGEEASLAGAAAGSSVLDEERGCALRALTFNVRYGDAEDRSAIGWRRRRRRVLDLVRLLRPDVIAFQASGPAAPPPTCP
jgi:hypothetical protein